jgi:hypothetical protein
MTGEANMSKISTLILAGYRPYRAKPMFVGGGSGASRKIEHYRLVTNSPHPARMFILFADPNDGGATLVPPLDPELQGWEPIEWTDIPFGAWDGLHVNLLNHAIIEGGYT